MIERNSRKHPIHMPPIKRLGQSTIFYVTVCTKDRKRILACDRVHSILVDAWTQAIRYQVGRYVVMPDHVHLFCAPTGIEDEIVSKWVAYWKRLVSVRLKDFAPVWQRDCWDTQIRGQRAYEAKWEYVRMNPVRHGLARRPDDWPYQGTSNEFG
jgi:putative transposase